MLIRTLIYFLFLFWIMPYEWKVVRAVIGGHWIKVRGCRDYMQTFAQDAEFYVEWRLNSSTIPTEQILKQEYYNYEAIF